ncbi:hypothetical protein D3Z38_11740 [Clostridiales bacterium]|nr:hypothetical protein [Clostridiales bacterium]
MEIYVEFEHNGNRYIAAAKVIGRKVKWAKAFKRRGDTNIMDAIEPVKVTTSTRREELACWLNNLNRKLRKKRRDQCG